MFRVAERTEDLEVSTPFNRLFRRAVRILAVRRIEADPVGDYRVIYRIEPPDLVLVVKIGHRREV